ncbi:energy coupling factor transporter S component ThiW [Virgibacillus natechei]|uniref:Energy coupling factor transporter S component ThiW n=1 Tax=Virgibacillus natechei TaxID=1216297 RepID=A0ABS4IBW5_9BACI|nr:energy coupling factor transporter S component ThiW [Virgibacillus natechei]MBP1968422.1 energy coupling factor transporter S component ThiW [Virgibacillus natechei]UZD13545.1 energy coupling factor transporter S component ThiW [Virgibacillus natechei]
MNRTRLLTTMAVFVAIGTITAQLLWFPAGVARAYPVQHAVNVMAAVMLGPGPAVVIAFMISVLRNMLGLGTLLAFPGGMVGAFLAGYLYKKIGKKAWAVFGEAFGSGVIGSLFAVPFAQLLMGSSVGAFAFMPAFLVSSITGAFIGWFIISKVKYQSLVRI